jgi:CubicO group peptidase (beta-lactamase class C family)
MWKQLFIIGLALALPLAGARAQEPVVAQPAQTIAGTLSAAASLSQLKAVVVARDGKIVAERGYGGHTPAESANIKSASKSIISALVGIAISKGLLEGVDQPIAPILAKRSAGRSATRGSTACHHWQPALHAGGSGAAPPAAELRPLGLQSATGCAPRSPMPFADDPGGQMLYSTGSTHLLSAILTKVGGKSTLALAPRLARSA